MGGIGTIAVVCAAAAAAWVAVAPRPGPVRLRDVARSGSPPRAGGLGQVGGALRAGNRARSGERRTSPRPRLARVVASILAAAAGGVFVGGVAGWFVAAGFGLVAWVGLGRVEPGSVVRRRQRMVAAVPLAAELLAAAVAAGAPPDRADEAVGRAIGGPLGEALAAAAASARVGADPDTAWAGLLAEPAVRSLGRVMVGAATRGASPVEALERAARDARDSARWTAEAHARSIGARAAAPLGLCFLPAFVLVGIVPLVATLGMPLLP